MNPLNTTGRLPGQTDALLNAAGASAAQRPETFRLPKLGGDPFFGFGRSFYYRGEQLGYWRLVRIRERGKLRGVTLVPYDEVAKFVRSQMELVTDAAKEVGNEITHAGTAS